MRRPGEVIQIATPVEELLSFKVKALKDGMEAAAMSMGFASMLAVLFIGARMRALNLDPVNGAPQRWAQNFLMCTHALMLRPVGPRSLS